MEENMTMINEIEENGNVDAVESDSNFGEKALATTIIVTAVVGTIVGVKWIAGKVKGFIGKKKAKAANEEVVYEGDYEEVNSEEESD